MTITVGTDTYVTVAEATAYLEATRKAADAALIAWKADSDDNKEIDLRNATRSLERLKYPGTKELTTQVLSFPRCGTPLFPYRRNYDAYIDYGWGIGWNSYGVSCQDDVPDEVKYAQIEEAFEMFSPTGDSAISANIQKGKGVKSFRSGDFSKTYNSSGSSASSAQSVLKSISAQQLIAIFANGTFRVQ